jgi:hypothetical protein
VGADKELVETINADAKRYALARVAIFPAIMLVCYIALMLYFKSRGGYKVHDLSEEEEGELMGGGVPGPVR